MGTVPAPTQIPRAGRDNDSPHIQHTDPTPQAGAVEGALAGQEFGIPHTSEGLTLGRDTGNDVRLTEDTLVSRQHAQILCESEGWVLYDRDSVNGVFINNRRVMRHVLRHGDIIQMGNTRCRYDAGSQAASPPRSLPPRRARAPTVCSYRPTRNLGTTCWMAK
jgi:predicted component of type VI protein secretion system